MIKFLGTSKSYIFFMEKELTIYENILYNLREI